MAMEHAKPVAISRALVTVLADGSTGD